MAPFAHFGGSYWLHDLFLLLIVLAVIAGIYVLVRGFTLHGPRQWGPPPGPGWHPGWRGHNPAVDELDLRYARGEVSREEYLQRRADLLGGHVPPVGSSGPGPGPAAKP